MQVPGIRLLLASSSESKWFLVIDCDLKYSLKGMFVSLVEFHGLDTERKKSQGRSLFPGLLDSKSQLGPHSVGSATDLEYGGQDLSTFIIY